MVGERHCFQVISVSNMKRLLVLYQLSPFVYRASELLSECLGKFCANAS